MQGNLCTLHGKSAQVPTRGKETCAFAVSIRPYHRLVLRLVTSRQKNKLQRSRSSRITSTAHDMADTESADKMVWVQTANMVRPEVPNLGNISRGSNKILQDSTALLLQEVLTSAVESGLSTFLFPEQHQHLAGDWKGVVQFEALHCQGDTITSDGSQVVSQSSALACRKAAANTICCMPSRLAEYSMSLLLRKCAQQHRTAISRAIL